MPEFWLARVFHADGLAGNLTGVIYADGSLPEESYQAVAARLTLPDTAFLSPANEGRVLHRSFSPTEELSFCTQTLLASAAVEAERTGARDGPITFETRIGPICVIGGGQGLRWVEAAPEPAQPVHAPSGVLGRLGLDDHALAGPCCISGIGRRRLYVPLGSLKSLHALKPSPSTVLEMCAEYSLTGVCLFMVQSPGRIALRVFTTSLAGAEDAATGGAALGLLGYDQHHSLGLEQIVRVEQGRIDSWNRGCLYVAKPSVRGGPRLGGKVAVLAQGSLLNWPLRGADTEQ